MCDDDLVFVFSLLSLFYIDSHADGASSSLRAL
jgi:hypothetical protein